MGPLESGSASFYAGADRELFLCIFCEETVSDGCVPTSTLNEAVREVAGSTLHRTPTGIAPTVESIRVRRETSGEGHHTSRRDNLTRMTGPIECVDFKNRLIERSLNEK
jgi:hypothetical protein